MIKNAKIIAIDANPVAYHAEDAKRGTVKYQMSSSSIRAFGGCPSRWHAGYEPPESGAKEYGSLLDTFVLQPKSFKQRYAIKPLTYKNEKGEVKEWNGNSNVCKKWLEDHKGFEITSDAEVKEALEANRVLLLDETIKAFLECSDRAVHIVGEWHDPETKIVVPLKALVDLLPRLDTEFCKSAGDLKSTRNAALMPWTKWCYTAGYHIQAAFYADLIVAAQPERDLTDFCFILSENYPPYQSGKRLLSGDFMEMGRSSYRKLLAAYSACMAGKKWPGYDDHDEASQGWSLVSPLPYMEGDSLFAPKFNFEPEDGPPEDEPDRFDIH